MSANAPGGDVILGSLRSQDGAGVVRIQDRYNSDAHSLWSALTDPARISQWYGRVEGDLLLGGEFRLNVEFSGWEGTGRVEACDPSRRLLLTTRETDESFQQGRDGQPSPLTIEVTLTADGDQTDLVIEVCGTPLELVAFYGAGWQVHAENLGANLDGRPSRSDVKARFDELVPAYKDLAALVR